MKDRQIKYSDFPKIEEVKDIALEILQSGKMVTASILGRYLKIKENTALHKLCRLEKKGLCESRIGTIKDKSGKPNRVRIYYIKDK